MELAKSSGRIVINVPAVVMEDSLVFLNFVHETRVGITGGSTKLDNGFGRIAIDAFAVAMVDSFVPAYSVHQSAVGITG